MKPDLYMFSISHYCEKARWALDYLGIDYRLRCTVVGAHTRLTKKYGLDSTSVPILVNGDEVIQGSSAIIDWADRHATNGRTLTPPEREQDVRAMEGRLDDIGGVHLRRFFYSNTLADHPDKVKGAFLIDVPLLEKLMLHVMWSKITPMMQARLDTGPAQGEESRQILDDELRWLDERLADGREFLVGDSFSRADLTASALLSRLAGATEHPYAAYQFTPDKIAVVRDGWRDRPSLAHVRKMYQRYRNAD